MKLLTVALLAWFLQERPTFRSGLELVTIPCTVLDAQSNLVGDLTQEEFRVFDNGTRRLIDKMWVDTDQPLTLGVVIDASESQQDQLAEHRQTVLAILEKILRPGDRAFVVSMAEDIRIWAEIAGNVAEVRKQLALDPGDRIGEPCTRRAGGSVCGNSPVWKAIYHTAQLQLQKIGGAKALLILTDGFDTGSDHTWRQAADEVERAEASVYAIQYPSGHGGRFAPDLYRLLEESGGTWFGPPEGKYDAIVSRMESDLRHRYVLGFRPDSFSGKLRHEVRVEVSRPGLTVRSRKAYFK